MYHDVYEELYRILRNDLLFGLSDNQLGPLKESSTIVDDPQCWQLGYGFLALEHKDGCGWQLIQTILHRDNLRQKLFYINAEGDPVFKPSGGEYYLQQTERFKELVYFLFHQIPGMPKHGAEEIQTKVVDTEFQARNLYYLFGKLACVGFYNKRSHNTGTDKVALHFMFLALEKVIWRYYLSVTGLEAWIQSILLF
ncbi:hypothetical protein BJ138DRAFT_1107468 [Hygrophoropsis aurantiaca]|uniref:Uncharacterized protein n=1 Tax=Hygrophoropsis aurantiaca TaxID=72124 RepID=A0ACB7ZSK9_9AGAM|nr:hypothetical protein BJ138DRAFT_1107468 [Hygrophoropsis aurantiaca]